MRLGDGGGLGFAIAVDAARLVLTTFVEKVSTRALIKLEKDRNSLFLEVLQAIQLVELRDHLQQVTEGRTFRRFVMTTNFYHFGYVIVSVVGFFRGNAYSQ